MTSLPISLHLLVSSLDPLLQFHLACWKVAYAFTVDDFDYPIFSHKLVLTNHDGH